MAGRTLTFLRAMDWLDSGRVRGYAALVGLASLALLAVSWVQAMGPDGTDFLAFWGAGHVTAAGDPAAAYDLAVQEQVQTSTGSVGWFAFVNPPPFLFLAAPFGALPFPLAWVAWVAVWGLAWAWLAMRAFPRLWPLVAVFPGALLAAGHAQTGFLTGALLIGGVTLVDRRPWLAGLLIGGLIIKPHLALLLPFWLAGGRRWQTFAGAAVGAIGLIALSWLAFGTQTMLAYTTSWQASAAIMQGTDPDFFLRMSTPFALLRPFIGAGPALGANVALAIGLAAASFLPWRRFGGDARASGAFVLAATALASPYQFNYDLPFLIMPLLWWADQALRHGFRPWEKFALISCWCAPYATRAFALPLEVNAMPLFSLILLAALWGRGKAKNRVSGVQEQAQEITISA